MSGLRPEKMLLLLAQCTLLVRHAKAQACMCDHYKSYEQFACSKKHSPQPSKVCTRQYIYNSLMGLFHFFHDLKPPNRIILMMLIFKRSK